MSTKLIFTVAILCFLGIRAIAQVSGNSNDTLKKKFGGYPSSDEQRLHTDWANLNKFKDADQKLSDTVNSGTRVVFMGNSILERWLSVDPTFFKEHTNYINRGISGQTTPQMLIRFRQDVIKLKPRVVFILAGTNDIAGNTGPSTLDDIFGNLESMYQLAAANHIRVIIASVLPAYAYFWRPELKPAEKIMALNKRLKEYADAHQITYVDFFSVMADSRNGLPPSLTEDGVHPNQAGYAIMGPLVQKAVNKTLSFR